jgi:hypothetical protein
LIFKRLCRLKIVEEVKEVKEVKEVGDVLCHCEEALRADAATPPNS